MENNLLLNFFLLIFQINIFQGGLAGALAQLTLGAPRSAEQQAYEESMRRQCWEAGNIDYLGMINLYSINRRKINFNLKNKIFLNVIQVRTHSITSGSVLPKQLRIRQQHQLKRIDRLPHNQKKNWLLRQRKEVIEKPFFLSCCCFLKIDFFHIGNIFMKIIKEK